MANIALPVQTWRQNVVQFCVDAIFPPVCACCRKVGTVLCEACHNKMVLVSGAICLQCGRQIDKSAAAKNTSRCPDCQQGQTELKQIRAPLLYVEPTSTLIQRLKYDGYFSLAAPLARFLIDHWPDWTTQPDLIVPIPLHRKRQRQRGFNQSMLLARPLSVAFGIEYSEKILKRIRHTVPQVGLGPDERRRNVQGAFAVEPGSFENRHILLVDDVLTTGATMRAAAETLMAAGAASISAYCLARAS